MTFVPSQSVKRRYLELKKSDVTNLWNINETTWDDVIDSGYKKVLADPGLDDVEIWDLHTSSGGWYHPLHIHLGDFQILSRNGRAPFAYERGPKDVAYIGPDELVRVIMKFERRGRYMVHCHNLPHEDHDMMGRSASASARTTLTRTTRSRRPSPMSTPTRRTRHEQRVCAREGIHACDAQDCSNTGTVRIRLANGAPRR